jgi:hypothetical protein
LFGTSVKLLPLGHTDGFWQLVPLLLIMISLAVLGRHAAHQRSHCIRAFQGTMILFVASGVAGLWLHYQGLVKP